MPSPAGKPVHFKTPAAFRAWLHKNHATKTELWIGYYKKASGKGGMVYKEALDEALCYGWIDGVLKSVDGESYMQRWTPRKKDSYWSLVNIRRFGELDAAGRVEPSGRAAFDRRDVSKRGRASYELPEASFTPAQLKKLRANPTAFEYYETTPPGYQRVVKHWITRAKQEATRERRLKLLIDCCARGERVSQFVSPTGKGSAAKKTGTRKKQA
jgi:uncharacterized protein YdeI (YjbR/CyaY-like superfamily)